MLVNIFSCSKRYLDAFVICSAEGDTVKEIPVKYVIFDPCTCEQHLVPTFLSIVRVCHGEE